jgi:hypothetical protein
MLWTYVSSLLNYEGEKHHTQSIPCAAASCTGRGKDIHDLGPEQTIEL